MKRVLIDPNKRQMENMKKTYTTERLGLFEKSSENIRQLKVGAIVVNQGCAHQCSFCMASVPYFNEKLLLPLEIIRMAKARIDFATDILLTGGEPLEHPEIIKIAEMCSNGFSIVTNGFSGEGIPKDKWQETLNSLNGIKDGVIEVSFHLLDRWKGNKPGRNIILKNKIFDTAKFCARLLCELGSEQQTITTYLNTILDILETTFKSRYCKVNAFGYQILEGTMINELYSLPVLPLLPLIIQKVGKGKDMVGLSNTNNILPSLRKRYFSNSLNIIESTTDEISKLILLTNGKLLPACLSLDGTTYDDEEYIIGTVDDSHEKLVQNLKEAIKRYCDREKDISNDRLESNILESIEDNRLQIESYLMVLEILGDPKINELINNIERYCDLRGRVNMPNLDPSLVTAYTITKHNEMLAQYS
ncbi:MAG: radical SAM protein [Candidatus Micrarchaeia archaeon]